MSGAHITSYLAIAALILGLTFGFAGCGHDTDRANPLDAELTPAVELMASQDSTGSVTLQWSRYAGDQPFAGYVVLRNVARSIDADTVATIDDATVTAFVDSTLAPDTAYEYRVAVRNRHGLLSLSESRRVEGFRTRAVVLQPQQADMATGTVRVVWSAYRDPGFERYEVFRRAAGTDADSLLGIRADAGDTTIVDTTALHGINYLYRTVVVAAGLELTSVPIDSRLDLPAVELEMLSMDAVTATATLAWSSYEGPRFASYDIWRRVGDERSLVASLSDPKATQFQDTGLRGGVVYAYEVEVVSTLGERISGPSRVGSIHGLVDQWSLELLSDDLAVNEFIRLYAEGDSIIALVTSANSSQLNILRTVYDGGGSTRTTSKLVELRTNSLEYDARASSIVPRGDGLLLATTGVFGLTPGLLALDSGGNPLAEPLTLRVETGQASSGQTTILAVDGSANGAFVYGDIAVSSEGDRAFASPGFREIRRDERLAFYKDDGNWVNVDVQLESYVINAGGLFHLDQGFIYLGETATRGLALSMAPTAMSVAWVVDADTVDSATALSSAYVNIDRRSVRISQVATGFEVTVEGAAIWSEEADATENWSSLAEADESTLLTIGNRPYLLRDGSAVEQLSPEFSAAVSETRSWSVDGERSGYVGICLPDLNQVHFNQVFRNSDWSRLVTNSTVGPLLSEDAGTLFYPLSLDGSADGRVYVLDAGNSRIVVLDMDGNYITQFGRHGDGPGEFDFLDGRRIGLVGRNYAGSVAVDDDGFIYVADVGNRRIQKFAP